MASKKTDRFAAAPIQASPPYKFLVAMRPLTGKWKIEILAALSERTHRFGELRRALPGVTQHVLASQLKELEADGLVTRTAYPEKPPRVEYCATEAVAGLEPVFEAVIAWSETYNRPSREGAGHIAQHADDDRHANL